MSDYRSIRAADAKRGMVDEDGDEFLAVTKVKGLVCIACRPEDEPYGRVYVAPYHPDYVLHIRCVDEIEIGYGTSVRWEKTGSGDMVFTSKSDEFGTRAVSFNPDKMIDAIRRLRNGD